MFILSKKRRSKESKLAFIDYMCEMSRRADIDAIENSLKSYWKDKKANPWNRIYSLLEKYWMKERPDQDISNTLLLIRDGVFGALDIHSMSLALDVPTSTLVEMLHHEKSWKEGRRKVRTHCAELVSDMLDKGETRYFVPSGLERDGFGFLVPTLRASRIKQFKKARPNETKGKLKLQKLADTVLGRDLLRLHMITPEVNEKGKQSWTLSVDDPRANDFLVAYDNMILDLEIDETSRIIPDFTQQVTLNGKPLSKDTEERKESRTSTTSPGVQEPLTEYFDKVQVEQEKKAKKKTPQKKVKKKTAPKPKKKKASRKKAKKKAAPKVKKKENTRKKGKKKTAPKPKKKKASKKKGGI
jgi:hypothetical protein